MNIPNIELFEWLNKYSKQAKYVLANSNIPGLTYEVYQNFTKYSIPHDFDLNKNNDYGAEDLLNALCSLYSCLPENIVTTTGGSEANFLVFASLIKPGDEVIVEKPGYEPLYRTPSIFGANTVYWERTYKKSFELDLANINDLITKKTRLIVLTNLHNPSGVCISRKILQELNEIIEPKNIYLLIDEIFLDGSVNNQVSAFGLSNVIISSSMTKVYGLGGLRTGWIAAPAEIANKCQITKSHTTGCSTYISEILSSHILRNGKESLIRSYKQLSKTNISIIRKWINKNHVLLEWVEPHGGVVCFPKYHSNILSVDLCMQLFKEFDVLVSPGSYFNKEGYIRLSFGCDSETLIKGLEALEYGLKKIIGSKQI